MLQGFHLLRLRRPLAGPLVRVWESVQSFPLSVYALTSFTLKVARMPPICCAVATHPTNRA